MLINGRGGLVIAGWACLLVAVAGCGTHARVTPLRPAHAPRPADAPVALFSAAIPPCAFEELAVLMARAESVHTDQTALVERLKTEARKLGAHAVIDVREFATEGRALTGTAVRYADEGCGLP